MPQIKALPDAHTDFVFTLEPSIVLAGLALLVLTGLALLLFHWIRDR